MTDLTGRVDHEPDGQPAVAPVGAGSSAVPEFRSTAYGLQIGSNVQVPGLPLAEAGGVADVTVRMGALPPGLHCTDVPDAPPSPNGITHWIQNDYFRIRYADRTEFAVACDGAEVHAVWPTELSLEDTATYLLGPVLSLVLRLRGTLTLHASAVRIGDAAALFVGPQGAGKSTTAASFALAGFPVLTDDVAAIRDLGDSFQIMPAYPRIRLWPESTEMLFGTSEALPRLTPTWDKRYLDLGAGPARLEPDSLRLAAIYFLQPRSGDDEAPSIEPQPLRDGLVGLIGNLGGNHIITAEHPSKSFAVLHRIAATVPMRRLTPHSSPARLDAMRELVVADVERGAAASPSPDGPDASHV